MPSMSAIRSVNPPLGELPMPSYNFGESAQQQGEFGALRNERARQILEQHNRSVKQYVRLHLNSRIRNKEGTSAIAQDIFKSFFKEASGQADPDCVWPLLLTIAKRKVSNAARRYRRDGRRDVSREQRVSSDTGQADNVAPTHQIEDGSHNLAADEAAIIVEELSRLNERDREMIIMRSSGFTLEVIAQRLECSEREVRRTLERVYEQWRVENLT
jgi:RNA polymerase sigma factor (sigma-70 family)